MTITLPAIQSDVIPLPYHGEGYPPFADIPPGTFPRARRWRVGFSSIGTLIPHIKVPQDASYASEGYLSAPTATNGTADYAGEGELTLWSTANDPAVYTGGGTLDTSVFSRVTWSWYSAGDLEAATKVINAAIFGSEGILHCDVASITAASFTSEGDLWFGGGAGPRPAFGSEGSLTLESGIGSSASFSSDVSLGVTNEQVGLKAQWLSIGQLGTKEYEIEILLEPNFVSEGVVDAHTAAKGSTTGAAEGTLATSTAAKGMAPLSSAGSLAVKALNHVTAKLTSSGTLAALVEILGFSTQQMNKSGTWAVPNDSRQIVPSWVSDATDPATVSANKLVVTGDGGALIEARIDVTSGSNSTTSGVTAYLMLNGSEIFSSQVYSSSAESIVLVSDRTLVSGDQISIEMWRGANSSRTVQTTSKVRVRPPAEVHRERIVKVGDWAIPTSYAQVTSWTSSTEHPGTVTANKLVASQSGPASIVIGISNTTSTFNRPYFRLYVNGVIRDQLESAETTTSTLTTYANVVAGDEVWVESYVQGTGSVIEAGTYMEIIY